MLTEYTIYKSSVLVLTLNIGGLLVTKAKAEGEKHAATLKKVFPMNEVLVFFSEDEPTVLEIIHRGD